MAIKTYRATADLKENVKVETQARQHKVMVDEPANLGGEDTAENPVELLLSSLGACQAIIARMSAKQFGIDIESLKVELEGDIDSDGFMSNGAIRPGFSDIRYKFHIKTDAPEAEIEKFIQFVEANCPVGDTLQNPVNLISNGVVIERDEEVAAPK